MVFLVVALVDGDGDRVDLEGGVEVAPCLPPPVTDHLVELPPIPEWQSARLERLEGRRMGAAKRRVGGTGGKTDCDCCRVVWLPGRKAGPGPQRPTNHNRKARNPCPPPPRRI